jgi:hypothetical protein
LLEEEGGTECERKRALREEEEKENKGKLKKEGRMGFKQRCRECV